MSERKDGGPAFPLPSGHIAGVPEGMSLRDYFAGQAMLVLLGKTVGSERAWDEILERIPEDSYQIADAMLEEKRSIK